MKQWYALYVFLYSYAVDYIGLKLKHGNPFANMDLILAWMTHAK